MLASQRPAGVRADGGVTTAAVGLVESAAAQANVHADREPESDEGEAESVAAEPRDVENRHDDDRDRGGLIAKYDTDCIVNRRTVKGVPPVVVLVTGQTDS